ncbi:asparagine synthase (glutamine-hydrolyzing) [soil metagenome]
MCGIAGAVSFKYPDHFCLQRFSVALECLALRGPDSHGIYKDGNLRLGHRRLSIIDTSSNGNQPMTDPGNRYTIVFNGEFFNFLEHRQELEKNGVQFQSHSDTEVLLHLYMNEGPACLSKINGFFALAIYDQQEQTLFLARDRMGIKPLLYFKHDDYFVFASEQKALTALGIPLEIDPITLRHYFQLNYVPGPWSMVKGVRKLQPGHYSLLHLQHPSKGEHQPEIAWYQIPELPTKEGVKLSYDKACEGLYERLDAAVERRLISDVPLGSFLSGGVDSSIVCALAAKHVKKLHTFSIGFSDEPHFDETRFAEEVAAHCGTEHRVFRLKTDDLLDDLNEVLNYLDEPFADSSALAVHILSKETRKEVTVALSGDGGDELFAGYQKHRAEWMIRQRPAAAFVARSIAPFFGSVKGSRQSKIGNRIRQLHRFAEGSALSAQERYWRWCSLATAGDVTQLLLANQEEFLFHSNERTAHLTRYMSSDKDFNQVLLNDTCLVLPDDMLTKVDLMSMANSLEVRVPFLDYTVVEWAFSLPSEYKIDAVHQKKILKDSFRQLLPTGLFERKKQGFEVPLLRWLRGNLAPLLDELLNEQFIIAQGIFNPETVRSLRRQLHSNQPGEATARIWALLVFQYWWRKTIKT